MFAGRDIVCLGSQAWDSHRCTPQQIMSRMAGHRVLYVEPLRSPLWRLRGHATQSRIRGGALRETAPGLWVYTPPAIFLPLEMYRRSDMLAAFNHALASRIVARTAHRLGFVKPVYWVYQVTHCGSPMLRDAELVVYDCIDDWAGAASNPATGHYLAQLDERLCREADVLFVGSRALAEGRAALNTWTRLVPQGVDLANFLRAETPRTPVPSDLAGIARPIVGLVGVLNKERVDVDLLCYLADQRPDWSIVLVGPVWEGLRTDVLTRRRNIHLLGNKPPAVLGDYLAAFDVCVLPYLVNEFTRNIFPLKLYEYLASGKPFVSTPIPACQEFPDLIATASDPGSFLAAVERALAQPDAELAARRVATAMGADWSHRAEEKARAVDAAMRESARRRIRASTKNLRGAAAISLTER